jgi:hypothetical protein
MESLIIDSTDSSPKVVFDPANGIFEVSGESRPEDVRKFYEPILDWIDRYGKHVKSNPPTQKIQFNFIFEYFNSSSAKYVMDIMSKLNEIKISNKTMDIEICWHYDEMDEDMLEAGQEFQNITQIPFKFITL